MCGARGRGLRPGASGRGARGDPAWLMPPRCQTWGAGCRETWERLLIRSHRSLDGGRSGTSWWRVVSSCSDQEGKGRRGTDLAGFICSGPGPAPHSAPRDGGIGCTEAGPGPRFGEAAAGLWPDRTVLGLVRSQNQAPRLSGVLAPRPPRMEQDSGPGAPHPLPSFREHLPSLHELYCSPLPRAAAHKQGLRPHPVP